MANTRQTLKAFANSNGFNMVSKVRVNKSGYKYATFLSSDDPNHVENIYFGTRFAEEGGYQENDDLRLAELFVTETTNATGEMRLKLTDKEGDAVATLTANGYQSL